MRILISADMEGATGVTWPADCEPGTEQWQRFRRTFTSDVNAAVAGFFDGGASAVLINEAHSTQRNLLLEELDERADMLTGWHKRLSMMEGIDRPEIAGAAFLGYHAAAGVDGVLSHTYLPNTITGVFLDGVRASEGRLNTALAAEYGVPVVLVTGDDKTCEDAADYAPGATGVAVKECISRYAAICQPPARTAATIRAGAAAGMATAGRNAPAPGPHRVEVEFDATHLALITSSLPGVEQVAERRVGYDSASMTDAMLCFRALTNLAASAVEKNYG